MTSAGDATTATSAALLDTAKAWRDQDPDDESRAELDSLISAAEAGDTAATNDLESRFSARLAFGTAGLRGELGAGSNRMNRVLVSQAAAGFAQFLLTENTSAGTALGQTPSIVIGYDGRKNSEVFARDTAEIMAGAGVRAILLPRRLPTPVLAFAVRHLDVSAGVMVTASHNPAADNGYKVYLGGLDHGSQIVSPVDGKIAAQIDRVALGSVLDLPRSTEFETAGEDVLDEYVRLTAALAGGGKAPASENAPASEKAPALENGPASENTPTSDTAPVSVVYTAMHGVGWETARRVFVDAGFGEPTVVTEQIEPDAAFPTVSFPNPEEPGALDLAFARAREVNAELIIANDPDADRLAIAIPAPGTDTGWRRLSGNEVGSILGWRAAERQQASDLGGTLAASIVSSPALRAIAREYNLDYSDTLTGFKWISRVGGLAYGYEEALGYLVDPSKVRDKDGISAAIDFLTLVSELKAAGKTVGDHLNDFAAKFGAFSSSQISLRVQDLSDIPRIMANLRMHLPASVGSIRVDSIDDFAEGFGAYPPGDILRFWLDGGARIIVRPSGTEPKLKVYIDASSSRIGTPTERYAEADAVVAELDAGMRALIS
ncbi:phospho-sugar mutase [Glaciihabitans tibetensis]|uniref:phospho-sugar mutase n=1 Tax=Glaciihabitans tibetensis TaxID=1266600 RepID=UPI000D04E0BE|nr:phospho-sugar mutase [Glaciihabitans tibetensis]